MRLEKKAKNNIKFKTVFNKSVKNSQKNSQKTCTRRLLENEIKKVFHVRGRISWAAAGLDCR